MIGKCFLAHATGTVAAVTAVVALSLAASSPALARDWFVAPWGSNSASGDAGSPLATAEEAANRAASGDRVKLRGGTYRPSEGWYVGKSGITIESADGEWAVIDGSSMPAPGSGNGYFWRLYFVLQVGSANNVTVQNLEVRGGKERGIMLYNTANSRLYRCAVKDNGGTGILVEANTSDLSGNPYRYNTVDNCWVENNIRSNQNRDRGWGMGIGVHRVRDTTVTNNSVSGNWGEGIGYYLASGGYCGYNQVHDNYSVNLYLDNARWVWAEGNTIDTWGWTDRYRFDAPAAGIQIANENSYLPATNPAQGITLKNNTVKNCSRGIFYANYEQGGGVKDTQVYGNTVEGSWWLAAGTESANHSGTTFRDNVFRANGRTNGTDFQGTGLSVYNNRYE